MAVIDPGRFRAELSLQQVMADGDGMGGHTEDWSEVAKVFALVLPVTAQSRFAADQTEETVTHQITLRAQADLASGMRFVSGARTFEILTVHDPDETGRYLVCRTREKGR